MLIREYELSPEASRSMKGEVSLEVTNLRLAGSIEERKEAERVDKDKENKSTRFQNIS